jgi:hypothetical protein
MVAVPSFRYNPKARVPFLNRLAREFSRSKTHIFRLCTGERSGPLRARIIARQAELIRENPSQPATIATVSYSRAIRRILVARGMSHGDLAKSTGLARRTILNICCSNNRTRAGRAKIEKALGCEIWPRDPATLIAEGNTVPPLISVGATVTGKTPGASAAGPGEGRG